MVEADNIITWEEFLKHSTKDDLWLLINGKVYDVSKFRHPGNLHFIVYSVFYLFFVLVGPTCLVNSAKEDATGPFGKAHHSERTKIMMKRFDFGDIEKPEEIESSEAPESETTPSAPVKQTLMP